VNISDTSPELRKFLELTGFPAVSSLMGMGCIVSDEPGHLGMVGMHGTYAANTAMTQCDLVVGIGVRFDDRVTGSVADFAPNAKVIHFDIDPAEINKNIISNLRVVGDLRWALPLLNQLAARRTAAEWRSNIQPWVQEVNSWMKAYPLKYCPNTAVIMPQSVIQTVSCLTKGEAIIVTDVGQHQMWTAQFFHFTKPRTFLTSGGLGTMGYGLPAAIGAQAGLPNKQVVLFTGDGSIMMNCQEMATAADNGFPVKIIVMNNHVLGMVTQWQRKFYGERYSHTILKGCTDYVKLAEAMGITGFRVTDPAQLEATLAKALATPGPVLVDVLLPEDEDVLPMVPPGGRLDQMMLGD
jgi:acetolactate synthase-1/2/3 large subunit